MKDQELVFRKKLNLGIDAVGTIDSILSWDRLEGCFGSSFRFTNETRYELAKELAVQQARLQKLASKQTSTEFVGFQQSSKNLLDYLSLMIENEDNRSLISDVIEKNSGAELNTFIETIKSLATLDDLSIPVRSNDLYREIIRRIVKILDSEKISLSLHVQSTFNKFMTELDKQLPETIFPLSSAKYIEEGRIRILKDYLRGYLR
ncbi:hypothetical protein OA005_00990 [Paracoccaceae bacterium]|nr:hypothetical protein [Paracoccaceae bacterium]